MNNTVAEETEFTRAKTSVWWDIENCCVPKGCDARGIAQTLSSALMKKNYFGPLTISSYGNTNLIPNSVQQALSSTGIALNHVPSGRKDASDKKILTDMFLWVLDNPAPANIMFITADGDFSDALHKLRMRRYNILLVHPEEVSASLVACAKSTWIWRSLWPSACPPPPVTQCESDGQVFPTKPLGSNCNRIVSNNKLKGIYVPKVSNQIIRHETTTKKNKSRVNEDGLETYVCSLCSVVCVCPTVFESHLKGRKHAAMIRKQDAEASLLDDEKIQAEIIKDNSHLIETIEDLGSGKALENIDCLKWQNKELRERRSIEEYFQTVEEGIENENKYLQYAENIFFELNPEFSAPKEARESFDDIIKKLDISANLTREFEDLPKQNLGLSWGYPGSTSSGAAEHPAEYKDKNKDKVNEDEGKLEAYVCSICNVSSDCPTVFESHLMGPVHAAAVKLHAEVLYDDKKILEESLQAKDHPRGLLLQPIETQESLKEVCQTTKERVDDESEARERLDTIVERLEVSLEDTSNKKSSEAEIKSEKRKENGAATSHIRVCDLCNVMCTSQMDFNFHLGGKKHAAAVMNHAPVVKKQAGTNFIYARK